MSDILVFTNRSLCQGDFLLRIENLAELQPKAIVLREKNLAEGEYKILARSVIDICNKYGTACILHNFVNVARELNSKAIHLPLHVLKTMTEEERTDFDILGASCHSADDAKEAEGLGCTYITAGHVFDTDCKKGLSGRGIDFLQKVCKSVSIPVYAIGGISSENIRDVRRAGAAGACVMSGAMVCDDISDYLISFEKSED